ncbi:MAG: phosphotransferase family protein [Porticoccaceae bacterium]|jgi:aminoglycoside phosphotransferase (APT) family kinase protein|nr:phosphotransferase family protein [Porticoccaceae bacterium]
MFVEKTLQAPQNWKAISAFMAEQGIPLDEGADIEQFTSGLANLNYLLVLKDGRKVVFRRPPNGPLPPGAYDLAREFNIYFNLGKHLPFVPKGLALCEDINVIGVPFFIMEFCQGLSLGRELPAELNAVPMIGDKLSRLVIESLADLHKLDPVAVGLGNLGNPEGFITRQIKGWKKRGSLAFTEQQMPLMETIHQWLSENEPQHQPTSLVHHDYKLDNILIDPQKLEVSGVIDWEMATIGNPFFDLALTLAVWGQPGDNPLYSKLCMMPSNTDGWWTRQKALNAYLRHSGLQISENDWKFYWMLALLRMAVVFAQLGNLYNRQKDMKDKANPKMHISPDSFCDFAGEILTHAVALLKNQKMDF